MNWDFLTGAYNAQCFYELELTKYIQRHSRFNEVFREQAHLQRGNFECVSSYRHEDYCFTWEKKIKNKASSFIFTKLYKINTAVPVLNQWYYLVGASSGSYSAYFTPHTTGCIEGPNISVFAAEFYHIANASAGEWHGSCNYDVIVAAGMRLP